MAGHGSSQGEPSRLDQGEVDDFLEGTWATPVFGEERTEDSNQGTRRPNHGAQTSWELDGNT